MFNFFDWLFDTSDFPARWNCGHWTEREGYLHIISDVAIFGAYTAIPIVIGYFVLRRKDVPFPRIFWLFGAFIFACGTTHLLEAIIFWHPIYRVAGLVKAFTAIVSWATIVALAQITPQALRLPGLAKVNSELTKAIADRKATEEERERLLTGERSARAEAERESRIKDEFLSLVSHELRNPLNAILGYAQLIRHGGVAAADLQEGAAVIERNGWAQAQIIDDLLDMSRIISGKMRLDVQNVELSEVIEAAAASVQPAAQAKEIAIATSFDPQAVRVVGDPGRLQQVIWNLLSNALKFTPRGGHVQVSLAQRDSHVEIDVADTGQGIQPEFIPYVFDRFRQQDASSSRRHGGLGIGLSIVKHLVELHGGSVDVRSAGAGLGSTFTVRLPDRRSSTSGDHADGASDGESSSAWQGDSNQPRLDGLKVLVVDDESDARNFIKLFLEERGAAVSVADSADEALAAITRSRPDAILSDIGMPGTDGYQFIRRLRALVEQDGGRIPAAAVTAFARSEDRTRALLAGYQAHVTKPVNPRELVAVVAALTGRYDR